MVDVQVDQGNEGDHYLVGDQVSLIGFGLGVSHVDNHDREENPGDDG